jgi:phage-related protein
VAARNSDALTDRINATVDHLNETNKLISEMDQFKDLVADDLPVTSGRLGFDAGVSEVPPVLDANATASQNRNRARNKNLA